MRLRSFVRACWGIGVLGLAGCVTLPQQLNGAVGSVDPTTGPVSPGTQVRWGGTLLATLPMTDRTCFEILSRPLDSGGRPLARNPDRSGTRFMACQGGFADPESRDKHTEVTVLGRVTGTQTRQVGQYALAEPVVAIDGIQWWRPRPQYDDRYWGDPYWGPWGPWGPYPYGGWYGGWYGPRPVVIVHPAPPPPPRGR